MKLIILIAVIIFLIAIGPILTIWSLNTLFPALAIPYDIWTWLAVVILAAALRTNIKVQK